MKKTEYRILKMPVDLDNKFIKECTECPFYSPDSDGWSDQCNINPLYTVGMDANPFFEECPLQAIVITEEE